MTYKEEERYKNLSPGQKLQIAVDMYNWARELKAAGLRMAHPDWTEEEVQAKVREIFLYART